MLYVISMKHLVSISVIIWCHLILVNGLAAEENSDPAEEINRLTLDACVGRALANSSKLTAERYRLEALDAKLKEAMWSVFSNFSVEVFGSVVPDKCVDKDYLAQTGAARSCEGGTDSDYVYRDQDWGPTLRFKFKGGVPLYTFGKITAGKKAGEYARAAKQAEFPRFEHEIRYKVEQAYHAVAGAREMLYSIGKGRGHLEKAQ